MNWIEELESIKQSQKAARSYNDFMGYAGVFQRWTSFDRWCKDIESRSVDREYSEAQSNIIKTSSDVTDDQSGEQSVIDLEKIKEEIDNGKRSCIAEAEKMASSNDELLNLAKVWLKDFNDKERALKAIETAIAKAISISDEVNCAYNWLHVFSSPGDSYQHMVKTSAKAKAPRDLMYCANFWLEELKNEENATECIRRAENKLNDSFDLLYASDLLRKFKRPDISRAKHFERKSKFISVLDKIDTVVEGLLGILVFVIILEFTLFRYIDALKDISFAKIGIILFLLYCIVRTMIKGLGKLYFYLAR